MYVTGNGDDQPGRSQVAWGLIGNPILGRVQAINPKLEETADAFDDDDRGQS
jgi:hypothetical protein